MYLLFLKQKQKKKKIQNKKILKKKLFDPQNSAFMSFETKTLKKYFFIFFF